MSAITQYLSFSSGEVLPVTEEGGDFFLNANVDFEAIKRDINENYVKSKFRIFILHQDETVDREIPAEFIKVGGSYEENYQNGQRRSLSFTLYNYDGTYTPDINVLWIGTKLRFDMGLSLPDGITYWFKKGVYVINSTTPSLTPTGRETQISAGDKFSIFENASGKLSGTYTIPIKNDIESTISDILHMDTGNGYQFDPLDFFYPSVFSGKKVQVEISKSAGETLGSILLDLAEQLSSEIFYNSNGNLVFKPIVEASEDINKPLVYSFDTARGDVSQLNFNFDYNSVINRIIVIGTSSSGGTFTAEAVNDDQKSPLCYQRIGYRTGNVINESNIYSKNLAEERAEYELRQKLILKTSTQVDVSFNPFLEVNNVVALSDDFFDFSHERFLIQSVSCSLDFSGKMSITFSNLRNLPFAVN